MQLNCFFLVITVCLALATVNGKKKNQTGKKNQNGLGSLNLQNTCAGQSMHITIEETSVNACLETRFQNLIQAHHDAMPAKNEKALKKLEKKKEKLQKKLKKKCTPECEFESFGMIPNNTANEAVDADSIEMGEFLSLFPNEVTENLKTNLELCLNRTQSMRPKLMKAKKPANNLCAENRNLVKCFKRIIKRSCKLRGTKTPISPSMSSTTDLPSSPKATNNSNTIHVSTTVQPFDNIVGNSTKPLEENDDDEADEDDDEEEDTKDDNSGEESNADVTTSSKKFAPTSAVNISSSPLTK